MDDKTTSTPNMGEYKFTDPEVMNEPAAEQQTPAVEETSGAMSEKFSIKNLFNTISIDKRKFVVPGIIILAILLIYMIFSFYGSRKASLAEQKKMKAQEEMMIRQQPAIATPPPIVTQAPSEFSNEQMEKLNSVIGQKVNEATQEALKSNLEKISSLTDSMMKIQQDISDINQAITQLGTSVQQTLTEIESLKAKAKKKPVRHVPLPVYHIRAIVPGRVWLDSSDGKSVSLRVGNYLKGYGTVQSILPEEGKVVMSNGSFIQYGVNDF